MPESGTTDPHTCHSLVAALAGVHERVFLSSSPLFVVLGASLVLDIPFFGLDEDTFREDWSRIQ